MPSIELLDTGIIDDREAAFPLAIQRPDGEILCSYGVGGGALVTGHTEYSSSSDNGRSWTRRGVILPKDESLSRANFLKLTQSADAQTIYAYGSWVSDEVDDGFGERDMRAIYCASKDGGVTWSNEISVPFPEDCPLEVSHGILTLGSGRLLAPAATLPAKDRYGESVYVARSDDHGDSWQYSKAFACPNGNRGFFEHKFIEVASDMILGVCWTVKLDGYVDQNNTYVVSRDGGETWSVPQDTGLQGQTMTPIRLANDKLLVLYNQRHGEQGIRVLLVNWSDDGWNVCHESTLYDARSNYQRGVDVESGVDEFDAFQFGFPTGIELADGSILTTHWCHEGGRCVVRWSLLQVDWD